MKMMKDFTEIWVCKLFKCYCLEREREKQAPVLGVTLHVPAVAGLRGG